MYTIEFTETAKRFLAKIPKDEVPVLIKKIYELKENPFRYVKRLQGYKLWRLRVLKYRIIVDIVISGNKIIVLRIGLRKNVYL